MDLWAHADDHIARETGYQPDDITYIRATVVEPHRASLAAGKLEEAER